MRSKTIVQFLMKSIVKHGENEALLFKELILIEFLSSLLSLSTDLKNFRSS